jgi:hypothetical protein
MTAMLTVSIWHNVTRDPEGRHAGFGGFTPGDQMVKVFTYDTPATGLSPAGIAEDAFAAFNDAPRSDEAAALARQYRQRRLRSLSFPGNAPCCSRSCCLHRRAMWPRSSSSPPGERTSCERQPGSRRSHR